MAMQLTMTMPKMALLPLESGVCDCGDDCIMEMNCSLLPAPCQCVRIEPVAPRAVFEQERRACESRLREKALISFVHLAYHVTSKIHLRSLYEKTIPTSVC
jgi:hypothetical protein